MKCPLLHKEEANKQGQIILKMGECGKEKCAWWFKAGERCAILELVQGLSLLSEIVLKVESKIPHEKQFRR